MLVQEIANFPRRTDDYQLDPDVEAFLLRGMKAYYQQHGSEVCDDINKMVFLNGIPKPYNHQPYCEEECKEE